MSCFKQIVVSSLLFLTVSSGLIAQQLSLEDLLLEPSALLQSELGTGSNMVYTKTEGNNNELSINQVQQDGAILNLVKTLQVGENNQALVEQVGTGNQLVLIQNGANNVYSLTQTGLNNATIAIQNGNNNLIRQELSNATNVRSEFIQNGNDNEIIHITNGAVNQNFKIVQNGNGLKASIIQSN